VSSEGLWAHDLFREYIHHRIRLSATTNHLDLTFVLTFFEEESEKERRTMDADSNGRIERGEVEAYVKRLSGRLTNSPVVVVGGRRMKAVPLYEPKLDLLGYRGVEWAHHRLVLYYFAPVSPELAEGAVLRVQDPFWASLPAVVVVEGSGAGELGLSLRPEAGVESVWGRLREGEEREFKWVVERMEQRPPIRLGPAARE
jgi:hypothetical protein